MQEQENNDRLTVRLGIIVNSTNLEDIAYYNKQLQLINKLYPNTVYIVLLGYKPEEDNTNALDGVEFEYYKPVSIIHYFKYLKEANLDMLFIPLIPNIYNATSESYKKYLEAGINSIPVIVPNIHPYNRVVHDKQNGFMYGKPEDCTNEHFITYLKDLLLNNFGLIKLCGGHAYEDVKNQFDYTKSNIDVISKLFKN